MILEAGANGGAGLQLLLVLGGALFLGTVGARILRWLRFPQVLGYILIGLDVTEEDLIASYKVADIVAADAPRFTQTMPLAAILRALADTDAMTYPVVDGDGQLVGVISLADLRQSFAAEHLGAWVVAFDLMKPPAEVATQQMPLADAMEQMRQGELDCLPVLADPTPPEKGKRAALVGMLEFRKINRTISQEIVRRRQLAEVST